jgi:hypothetical protein
VRDSQVPLRFVVLRHDGITEPHFDLMFESEPGGALRTWRSPVWPIVDPVCITPLDLHRWEYLEYEGPLSNDRGHVRRVAQGTYIVNVLSYNQTEVTLSGVAMETLRLQRSQDLAGRDVWDARRP